MGEAHDRAIEEQKRQEEAKKRQEEFENLLNTPIGKDEVQKAAADADVNRLKLVVVRQKQLARITSLEQQIAEARVAVAQIDEALSEIEFTRSIVFRRSLNPVGEAPAPSPDHAAPGAGTPAMGEVVSPSGK